MTASATSVYGVVRAALEEAGLSVHDGPARDLPTEGGLIAQSVVLWPDPGLDISTRMSGGSSGRGDGVTAICVGATVRDALAVADQVRGALVALRISESGGLLRQTISTRPVAEPNADPARVSCALEFSTITKGALSG